MKYFITLLVSFILNINLFTQPVNIKIKLDKEKYLIYEEIDVLIEIKNVSEQAIILSYGNFSSGFKMTAFYEGEKISSVFYLSHSITQTFEYSSGASYYSIYTLFPFGISNSKYPKHPNLDHLKPGKYSLQLEYNFGKNVLNTGEDLIVKSNKIDFAVTDALSKLQQKQLTKYIELGKRIYRISTDELQKNSDEIIAINKSSPYSLTVLSWTIMLASIQGQMNIFDRRLEQLAEYFPNSYATFQKWIQSPKKIVSNEKFNNTSVQKFCKMLIESEKKRKAVKKQEVIIE